MEREAEFFCFLIARYPRDRGHESPNHAPLVCIWVVCVTAWVAAWIAAWIAAWVAARVALLDDGMDGLV